MRMPRLLRFLPLRYGLPVFAILVFFTSILVRVHYRGSYYPGWDILGPVQGLYLLSTGSLWGALAEAVRLSREFCAWNSTNSLFYTLIPGFLGMLLPWEYWAHTITFAAFLFTLWLILKTADLPFRDAWLLPLACGASPALLSFSVAGYPYLMEPGIRQLPG